MARWQRDEADIYCEEWARQWVNNFGHNPKFAGQYIGPLTCTLGKVRELHDGAGSNTERDRHFPEVYKREAAIVNLALKCMSRGAEHITWAHYVGRCYDLQTWKLLRKPMKQNYVAERLGISLASYYQRRDAIKRGIMLAITLESKVVDLNLRSFITLGTVG